MLDTYEAERRPVAATNVQRSLENAANLMANTQLLRTGTPPVFQPELLDRLWNGVDHCSVSDAEFAAAVLRTLASQSMGFAQHNIEYGYTYTSAAIVPDGTDPIRVYLPDARPGHPLPHAWLDNARGERLPVMDLVRAGRFLLIAGEDDEQWVEAAAKVAAVDNIGLDVRPDRSFDGRVRRSSVRLGALPRPWPVLPVRFVGWRAHELTLCGS